MNNGWNENICLLRCCGEWIIYQRSYWIFFLFDRQSRNALNITFQQACFYLVIYCWKARFLIFTIVKKTNKYQIKCNQRKTNERNDSDRKIKPFCELFEEKKNSKSHYTFLFKMFRYNFYIASYNVYMIKEFSSFAKRATSICSRSLLSFET